jgi:hypothetical protein
VNANVTALLVAVVGVTGTLLGTVLAQRLFMKNRKLELDSEHRQRLEERQREAERAGLEYRRDAYIRLNASARSFRHALKNATFGAVEGQSNDLELARDEFNRRYSEVQLIGPDKVLEVAHLASSELAAVYGRIKALETSTSSDELEEEDMRSELNRSVSIALQRLREAMRQDLGTAP